MHNKVHEPIREWSEQLPIGMTVRHSCCGCQPWWWSWHSQGSASTWRSRGDINIGLVETTVVEVGKVSEQSRRDFSPTDRPPPYTVQVHRRQDSHGPLPHPTYMWSSRWVSWEYHNDWNGHDVCGVVSQCIGLRSAHSWNMTRVGEASEWTNILLSHIMIFIIP